ncbi:hypothetical protein L227DRAFT_600284 [Lentinus tigrinus ALCF2SS1-6]|uniref:CST complex subunit STN1 n=1 Tax=Lentinus tigrinus ALCF2SS1-6 TaxID=1328759 RepID=A0A5C2SC46_9APHY|nr:hypothetical protein L227DRAFT_600284 [Lentinus tigrinus ALCF2SS1-6]
MSTTTTIPRTRTSISRNNSSILLSPSKRRRTDAEQPSRSKDDTSQRVERSKDAGTTQPTPAEIFRWTFTKAAIASCFVRDVFEMRECGMRDMEYFWLGRIPCRTVRLVGLVVGVQVWEKRTVYTLDDGTAVLDCAIAHAQVRPPSPVKPKSPAKLAPSSKIGTKGMKPSFADYLPSARRVPLSSSMASSSIASSSSTTSSRRTLPEPPPPPKPVVRVGQSARVVGRVVIRHDTRILLIDEIVPCASYNDESNHCIAVSDLHRTAYHPSEPLPPFVPPPLPAPSVSQFPVPTSPSKRAATQEPQTPASVRSAASSTTTSLSTVASSSPASSTTSEHQVRLRHPSRLHTRDLTANTFRIYVKHYMDNAPPPSLPRRRARSRSSSPSPTPRHSQRQRDALGTPTRSHPGTQSDATPRPSRIVVAPSTDRTPRPSLISGAASGDDSEDELDDDDQMYGYTLSHLRRVPELSLLARRVVKADAHRRAKEERKKEKEKAKAQGSRSQQPSASSASSASSARATSDAPLGPAVKRLFKQAIRTLFSEGDIVLWNGPVHPLPAPALDPFLPPSSTLWKANTSTSSTASSSISSSASASRYEEWDEDEALSDPTPDEEAYVPLTPAYFSRVLEGAIRTIMAQSARISPGEATPTQKKSASRSMSLIQRLRAQERASAGPPPGPTKEELLGWLRSTDERWARVGEWTVEEALQWGKREGRLWCVGKGRWEVCG